MEFWIKDEKNNIDICLPVTPASYEFTVGNNVEVVRATETGDIYIPTTKSPQNITLKGFFPAWDYNFCIDSHFDADSPIDYVKQFKKWIDKKTVVRVVIADKYGTKVNARFYVEHINYSEDDRSNGDINYSISFKEYKKIEMKTVEILSTSTINNSQNKSRAETKKTGGKVHIVKKGEYLCLIARKYYGNSNWQKLYNANKNVIGKNPNIIYPGQKLIIP